MSTSVSSSHSQSSLSQPGSGETLWGHPKGLFVLFLTEMWERFSYYGMRVLLVLYMTQYLFSQAEKGNPIFGFETLKNLINAANAQALSSQIYGLYTGLVYLTPVLGGILADRLLGHRRSVFIGGILMAIGHFLMAIESLFFVALVFIIFGNGFFKPNISTQVGALYPENDSRRDAAYTIFYMGINLGAFLSPLVCGTLGQKFGWHYGFGAAGAGMIISLIVYQLGLKHLPIEKPILKKSEMTAENTPANLTWNEKKAIMALCFLCVLNVFFWAVFEQQGNTLQLWSDANTDWNFFGLEIPSTWFQSFNPFLIFALAPLLTRFWKFQNTNNNEPSSVMKMGYGCLLLGVAMLIMVWASNVVGTGKGSLIWLFGCSLMLTIGELYLSPIGLSLVTKVAPVKVVSMMMGIWLMSSFFGNFLSGYIGSYYEIISKTNFFYLLAGLAFFAGFAFIVSHKFLSRTIVKSA